MTIAGPAGVALKSLRPEQLRFIQTLPKAELHAHLNGCIQFSRILHASTQDRKTPGSLSAEHIRTDLAKLLDGPSQSQRLHFLPLCV